VRHPLVQKIVVAYEERDRVLAAEREARRAAKRAERGDPRDTLADSGDES
jgi:hypothetical protein